LHSVLNVDLVGSNVDNVFSPLIAGFLLDRIFELAEDPTIGEMTYRGGDRVYATANLHGALSAITISYSYSDPGNYMWVHTTALDHPEN